MQIKLEKFEGPLELLLQLIEQEEMNITEISLTETASCAGTRRCDRTCPGECIYRGHPPPDGTENETGSSCLWPCGR